MGLLEYCNTERQRRVIEMHEQGMGYTNISKELDCSRWTVRDIVKTIKAKAAIQGYSPKHDMQHTVPDTFKVRGVSTYYNDEGKPVGQWVKSIADKEAMLQAALEHFKQGLTDDLKGLSNPIDVPKEVDTGRLAAYMIGDHHLGMVSWSPETLDDAYDIRISQDLLLRAVDKLVSVAGSAEVGVLLNCGDLLHANGLDNTTGAGTRLDVDTRQGKVIRAVGSLFKMLITRMLEKHKQVWIINVRGNHDPDASLWLNEMLSMYYDNNDRVCVFDNFSKWIHFTWGENLVVTHHGDRIKPQQLYENITRNYADEWHRKHRFCWIGHIHHKQAQEIGGMTIESWNVLAPNDAWHAGAGYGASRSMSCVILDKQFGEHSRFKVGIDALTEGKPHDSTDETSTAD